MSDPITLINLEAAFQREWLAKRRSRRGLLRMIDVARLLPDIFFESVRQAELRRCSREFMKTSVYLERKAALDAKRAAAKAEDDAWRAKHPHMSDDAWRETKRKLLFGARS